MKKYKRHPYHFLSLFGEASRGSKVKLVFILFCLLAYSVNAIDLRVTLSSVIDSWDLIVKLCSFERKVSSYEKNNLVVRLQQRYMV